MRSFWTDRRLITATAFVPLLFLTPAVAQHPGSGVGAATSGASGVGSSRGLPGSTSSTTSGTLPGTNSTLTRPIFLSGKVMFDDGTPTNNDIRIERVCSSSIRFEAHTDSKGRFSFQVGQEPGAFSDASESLGNVAGPANTGPSSPNYPTTSGLGGNRLTDPLFDCELRAVYPGFRSDLIDLSMHRSLDDPDVGTIVLRRLVNVKGSTISMTTELAPKHAQKEYARGSDAVQKGRLDEAEKDFTQATTLYPKYAIAWFALGQVEEREGKANVAYDSYLKASQADEKYVSPLDRIAYLSVHEAKWREAFDFSSKAIDLNPVEFPSSFWYNALAAYNLGKKTDAEKSLNALIKLDTQHHFAEAESLLSQVLLDKGNLQEAAVHLRAYLALVPNAKNANELKADLQRLEEASAKQSPSAPARQQ